MIYGENSGEKECLRNRVGAKGGSGHPFNKLTLLKTATFVLNFKLWPPPPDKRLAPLSRLLCRRLCKAKERVLKVSNASQRKSGRYVRMTLLETQWGGGGGRGYATD